MINRIKDTISPYLIVSFDRLVDAFLEDIKVKNVGVMTSLADYTHKVIDSPMFDDKHFLIKVIDNLVE